MKTAVATRFRCSSPLTDLEQCATVFLTLMLQYLNKLGEGKGQRPYVPKAVSYLQGSGFQWRLYQKTCKVL